MTVTALRQTRIHAGLWEGILSSGDATPHLEVIHLEAAVPGLQVTKSNNAPGEWAVTLRIPAQTLSEGVQTFVFRDAKSGEHLAHFTMITGASMESDLRAEVDLLRAELDLLKRAFRRHCVESEG